MILTDKKRLPKILSRTVENKTTHLICLCECGNTFKALANNIRSGRTRSCGCAHKYGAAYGLSRHPLYFSWHRMRSACLNESYNRYKDYGGRGITICDQWKDDFKVFYDWAISNGYEKGLQIDREKNDEGYTPNNCRFVTSKVNANNRRNTISITYNGHIYKMQDIPKITDIKVSTVRYRISNGWDIGKALTTPINRKK